MLRSMYAGVSGLKAHQVKMDVIGNNIANVNTVGFKGSRVNFKEMLNQTMRGAEAPTATRGGINPMQVGLGVGIGSIDSDFSQGNLQTTGFMTDIAIQGNGFFVLNNGSKNFFTRAGAFTFDQAGNLLHSATGYKIQGWMVDDKGELPQTNSSTMSALSLGNLDMTPKATSYVNYKGNLNSNKEVVDLSYSPEMIYITDDLGNSASLYVEVKKTTGAGTPDRLDDIWEWVATTDVPGSSDIVGGITTGNSYDFFAVALPPSLPIPGGSTLNENSLTVSDSTGKTYIKDVDYTIDYSTGILDWIGPAVPAVVDITLDFSSRQRLASKEVSLELTGTVKQIVPGAGNTFSIELYDATGASVATATVNEPIVGQEDGGYFTITGANASTISGSYFPQKSTAITVFDSKGNEHTLNINYVKTAENRWDWFANGPVDENGDPLTLVGNSGTIEFDAQGKVKGSPTGGPIIFQPSGAEKVVVTPDFLAVTQFAADDSIDPTEMDGFQAGSLESFSIDASGTIIGYYSNGMTQGIAKLAMASFSNNAGLMRDGETIYAESNNSGVPNIGLAGIGGKGLISPGTLEMSNVDLAEQFTEMITTQRGFQASSKIIATADQILQDLVNLKR
ncbi:MAG: flagellar hook protein FlgE [Halanaerobiales bacterium]|nr:flagellar hook protein FlgE [Halanaerobiales bacterium]